MAFNLGVPVDYIEDMDYEQHLKWHAYFEERPVGWREDFRTYRIMQSFGYKGKPEDVFESIAKMKSAENRMKPSQVKGLKSSALFLKMMGAKKGDKIGSSESTGS